jgi:hypothetical protein
MARNWEVVLSSWTGPASNAEELRYEWTKDQIREAISASSALARRSFDIYPKGSYPAFTNVVRDSDVDIAVELTEIIDNDFVADLNGMSIDDLGMTPYTGNYSLALFKDDVERALINHFGSTAVQRGKKAIHVRESRRGLAADVVPCQTHHTWFSHTRFEEGTLLLNDENPWQRIENFPKQHLARGTEKNDWTSKRYKRVVRILKRLENEMVDKSVIAPVPSFLIESMVWNVPDDQFLRNNTWLGHVQETLVYIYNGTSDASSEQSESWMEANGIKYLFHPAQSWTREQANDFTIEAWHYLGL